YRFHFKNTSWSKCLYVMDNTNRLQREYFNGVRYRSANHPVVRAYADPKIKFIRSHVSLTGSILDLGCGNGVFTQRLATDGASVVGLDFSLYLLKQNPGLQLTCGDALALPFRDASFDLVFEANLLHHVADGAGVIREMRRVSRKYIVLLE